MLKGLVLLLAAAAALPSCKDGMKGDAFISFKLSSGYNDFYMSQIHSAEARSGTDGTVALPDTNSFILTVTNSDGDPVYNGPYGERPDPMEVSAGSYDLSLRSVKFEAPAFSTPLFGDDRVVAVESGQTLSVAFGCSQLNCGMRLAELVGMNLGDIDLEQRQIRLFGKGHKERMVYLNDACVEALQLYLRKRNTMEGLSPKEKAVFITRMRKERISNRRVEQLISGAMKAAGLKGFSTHKLRHTAATLMYQTGNVDILTLKQLLGHSSVGTTQIYTHLQEFQVRSAIEENPLGKVLPIKAAKASLDTTDAAGETSVENDPAGEDASEPSGPMAAFEGVAQDGFRADISAMSNDEIDDSSCDT